MTCAFLMGGPIHVEKRNTPELAVRCAGRPRHPTVALLLPWLGAVGGVAGLRLRQVRCTILTSVCI